MKRIAAVLTVCFVAILAAGCSQQQKPAADTRAADEAAIRTADSTWSSATEAKQVDQHMSYYADDAAVLGPNAPMASGKPAIQKMITDMFAMPGFGLKWQATKVEAAGSGDIAYTMGTYDFSMNGPKGAPMADHGKYLTIWKKQSDGTWKVAVDTYNSDMPASRP